MGKELQRAVAPTCRCAAYSGRSTAWLAYTCLLVVVAGGCRRGPIPIKLPEIDPAAAAERAIRDFDADGDQLLSHAELSRAPGLAAAAKQLDTDRDKHISANEISARIRLYKERGAGIKSVFCQVLHEGVPLQGAEIKLVPEPFLGPEIASASGVTGEDGMVAPTVSEHELPSDLVGVAGLHLGLYRVEVTHPEKKISAKFHSETTLGCEVGPTTRALTFRVTTR